MDHVTETNPHFLTRSSLRAIKGSSLMGQRSGCVKPMGRGPAILPTVTVSLKL